MPSFGDILERAAPAPVATTAASNPIGGADGGLRLAKRAYAVKLGVDNVRMTVRKATTQILTGMLYYLASTALTTLVADSGQSPSYREFVLEPPGSASRTGFPGSGDAVCSHQQSCKQGGHDGGTAILNTGNL